MGWLEEVLLCEIPNLEVDGVSACGYVSLSEKDIIKAFRYIGENSLVNDAIEVLSTKTPQRNTVGYPIIFKNQKGSMSFEVRLDYDNNKRDYTGFIQTEDCHYCKINEITLRHMRLRGE